MTSKQAPHDSNVCSTALETRVCGLGEGVPAYRLYIAHPRNFPAAAGEKKPTELGQSSRAAGRSPSKHTNIHVRHLFLLHNGARSTRRRRPVEGDTPNTSPQHARIGELFRQVEQSIG